MTPRKQIVFFALAASAAVMLAQPVSALPPMHSYQPYSGLQSGFRPAPPAGAQTAQPGVILPRPVAPLIQDNTQLPGAGEEGMQQQPYASQGYSYCSNTFEGTLTPGSGNTGQSTCP